MGGRLSDQVGGGKSGLRQPMSIVDGPSTAGGVVGEVVGEGGSGRVGDRGIPRQSAVPRLNESPITDEKGIRISYVGVLISCRGVQCRRTANSARGVGSGCFGDSLISIVGQGPKGISLRRSKPGLLLGSSSLPSRSPSGSSGALFLGKAEPSSACTIFHHCHND